jgi:hypothetical protein
MENDTHDVPRWEDAFSADRDMSRPDTATPVDEEPWGLYRTTGAATIEPTYVEAYLERFDADPGRVAARHRLRSKS